MHCKGENTKSIISQKLRIAQKKTHEPNRCQINLHFCIFPVNLAIYEQFSLRIFCNPFGDYNSKTKNLIFIRFSTLRIVYVKMATSEGKGGRGDL